MQALKHRVSNKSQATSLQASQQPLINSQTEQLEFDSTSGNKNSVGKLRNSLSCALSIKDYDRSIKCRACNPISFRDCIDIKIDFPRLI